MEATREDAILDKSVLDIFISQKLHEPECSLKPLKPPIVAAAERNEEAVLAHPWNDMKVLDLCISRKLRDPKCSLDLMKLLVSRGYQCRPKTFGELIKMTHGTDIMQIAEANEILKVFVESDALRRTMFAVSTGRAGLELMDPLMDLKPDLLSVRIQPQELKWLEADVGEKEPGFKWEGLQILSV
jgi:hypothetical protein